jgi:hypothetical protein
MDVRKLVPLRLKTEYFHNASVGVSKPRTQRKQKNMNDQKLCAIKCSLKIQVSGRYVSVAKPRRKWGKGADSSDEESNNGAPSF